MLCTTPFREQHKQDLTRVEREAGGPAAQPSKKTRLQCHNGLPVQLHSGQHSVDTNHVDFHPLQCLLTGVAHHWVQQRPHSDFYEPIKGRVHFAARNPQNGDASITISNVSRSDSMTYICRVMMFPDTDQKMMTLTVMEEPSQPICNLHEEFAQGNNLTLTKEEFGQGNNLTLTCLSFHGESPLTYTWAKISGNQVLPADAVVDSVTLRVDNITEGDCGRYRCAVESLVGSKTCELVLPCPVVSEAEVSITVVVVILGVAIITAGCLWWYRKNKQQYFLSEIVGDVPPAPLRALKKEEMAPSLHYKVRNMHMNQNIHINKRGVTVQASHVSVCTSVSGSRFSTRGKLKRLFLKSRYFKVKVCSVGLN
ncbi:coxsackievirus and adenovirus receptor homolog [Corythoichthys intestinalis]|uniref:coxsackievirus and adenovirus receptor homolog n=1 Tax=Corythoichthys intestinalis TaxID=161448 RepID=UPI0025A5D731|nr:coxsackievirus and adenovirus receptor homolog [Corythoichthys intestinalis]